MPTYVVILDTQVGANYSSMYKLVPTYVVILDTQVGANNSLCSIYIQNINQFAQFILELKYTTLVYMYRYPEHMLTIGVGS